MDEFEVPPAKKPRLEMQSGGGPSSPVDDMDDFYDTPPAAPGSVPRSPEKVPKEVSHSPEVVAPAASFSLPGLQAAVGGSNNVGGDFEGEMEDADAGGAGNVLNGALGKEFEEADSAGTTGVSRGAFEDQGNIVSLMKPLDNTSGGVTSAIGDAQNTIGRADLDQKQDQASPSNLVMVSTTSDKGHEQMDWEGSPNFRTELRVSSKEPDDITQKSDLTSNDPVAPQRGPLLNTTTKHDELTVVAVLPGLQSGNIDAVRDIHDCLQPPAVPVTLSDSGTESHLPADQSSEQQVDVSDMQDGEAEFELESSPIESSSEDSSGSSSEESSDNDYEMLDSAEQARLLMQEDGGSDDEGGKKGAASAPLRTLNEKPDEIVEKPNIVVTEDIQIDELGEAETIVENLVLVKAKTSGEYQVLETGSLLCLKDRAVVGVVAETLGRVQQPLYTIRFTNIAAISEAAISKGTPIYYVPQHSTFVFTQAIKAIKGSDASNIHDEEVGEDELEFSDDEAEAEFKRSQKLQRQAKRGGRVASTNEYSRGPRQNGYFNGARNGNKDQSQVDAASISYDDEVGGDDDLYTPLVRPSNLHEHPGRSYRVETSSGSRQHDRAGRGRGGYSRGRGDRGRADPGRGDERRGNRERGRDRGDANGGFIRDRGERQGGVSNEHSRHPAPGPNLSLPLAPPPPTPPYSMGPPQPPALPSSFTLPYPPCPPQQTPNYQPYSQGYPSGQPQYPYPGQFAPHLPHFANFQHASQQYRQQSQYSQQQYPPVDWSFDGHRPPSQPTPQLPPGSFVNPEFFGNNFQQPPRQPQNPPQYGSFPPSQPNGS